MSSPQVTAGLSFPPSKSYYIDSSIKKWDYTQAQWKELYAACMATTLKNRTAIAKAYYTSIPTIQKYSGNPPKSRKSTVAKKPQGIKLNTAAIESDTPPKAPVIADGQPTLRKPFKPLPVSKNRVLSKLEQELDNKRQEVANLEAALAAINVLDVEMIKAILA